MLKVVFPKNTGQHYYSIHYRYLLNLFKYTNCEIEYADIPEINDTAFQCYINSQLVVFDYADCGRSTDITDMPVFVFHYKENECKDRDNYFPFSPVSFYDWDQYFELEKQIEYKAEGKILNINRPYGNATNRRIEVQNMLRVLDDVDFELTKQVEYWNKVNDCLVSIHVPGQNNHILDRSQLQLMAFGCCTISPELPEIIPGFGEFTKYQEYNCCKDDYSDLIDTIEWCKRKKENCIEYGQNAKNMFQNYCTPSKLMEYIWQTIQK